MPPKNEALQALFSSSYVTCVCRGLLVPDRDKCGMTMGQTTFIDLPEELAEASNSACNKSPFRPGGADKCKLRSLHQVENVILSVRHFAARSFASLGATR